MRAGTRAAFVGDTMSPLARIDLEHVTGGTALDDHRQCMKRAGREVSWWTQARYPGQRERHQFYMCGPAPRAE